MRINEDDFVRKYMRAGFSSGSIEWTSIEESVGEGLSVLRGRTRTGKVG